MKISRFKGLIDGIWVYSDGFMKHKDGTIIIITSHSEELFETSPIENNTLCEFTGMQDNNGTRSVDVFGGDILYNSDRQEHQEVIYNEDEARWGVRYSHGEQRNLADAIGNLNTVVGNIHENPELLK